MSELRMFTDGNDTIIAHSVDEVMKLWRDAIGDDYGNRDDWSRVPEMKPMRLVFPDEKKLYRAGLPENSVIGHDDDWNCPCATATVQQWIDYYGNPFWFSSQEW